MRQKNDILKFEQLRVYRRFVLKDIEAGARELARAKHPGQSILVDHLTPRRVYDVCVLAQ